MTIKASSYPTSRPTLDLNFAQTKRLDPRVTFSRASTATFTGFDGLIQTAASGAARFDHNPTTGESLGLLVEEARTNQWSNSSRFTSSNWNYVSNCRAVDNTLLAPDGTFTAGKLIAANGTNSVLYGRSIVASSTAATVSFYAKKGEYRYIAVGAKDNASVYKWTQFDLETGTVVHRTSSVGVATIQAMQNGWYKCSADSLQDGTYKNQAFVPSNSLYTTFDGDLSLNVVGDGSSGIYIWGDQLELASFPTSYIPTPATFTGRTSTATFYNASGVIQTAASGVARSDAYFPDSSGVMRSAGLLLEAAGTNLVTYSEQFDQWGGGGVTVTTNTTTAPDGTSTADKVIPTAVSAVHYKYYTVPQGAGTFTFSVYAKAAGYPRLGVRVYDGAAYQMFTAFDVSAGTIVSNTAGTAKIESVGNGWYRCSCTGTTVTGSMGSGPAFWVLEPLPASANAPGTAFTGDGTSGTFMWGAQIEASPYPTSYIPTVASTVTRSADTSTSATVTRSADVAQITGTNFSSWYNQLQGSVFCQFNHINSVDLGNYYIGVWGIEADPVQASGFGLSKNDLTSRTFRAQFYFNFNKTGGSQSSIDLGDNTMPAFVTNKSALVYSSTGVSAAINASLGTNTSNQPVGSATMNTLHLGRHYHSYYPIIINGTIARLAYWSTRLSDATLQAITR